MGVGEAPVGPVVLDVADIRAPAAAPATAVPGAAGAAGFSSSFFFSFSSPSSLPNSVLPEVSQLLQTVLPCSNYVLECLLQALQGWNQWHT